MQRIKYKDGYKYQLHAKYIVRVSVKPLRPIETPYVCLAKNGALLISKGYAWDGASGPTRDTKNSMRASLVHDGLYQLMRMKLLDKKWRREADDEFYRILREDGMSRARAYIWWRSVRRWAARAASPKSRKKVLTAA